MAYKIPWSNFHELNLDWLLEQVKQLREVVDGLIGSATPSNDTPEMDRIGGPGTYVTYSRGDHRHPTDTSRAAASVLTQEITDRGNADITLQNNIDAVDAKIKFSSAAPIMDSSSASAGFSDYMARADHIHPTDTSRASATDLALLQARVDGFTGSALPSDLTPNMDGVGSAGTGGNYSRGDHVHPSDTSKLDVAGGTVTGDLGVDGLLQENRNIATWQSSAPGWYRVAIIPNVQGSRVEITIARKSVSILPEMHKLVLSLLANPVIEEEDSLSDTKIIDRVRYTSAGALDVHVDQNYVSDIYVYLKPAAPTLTALKAIHTVSVNSVSDTPVGETILVNFVLSTNGVYTGTFTPATGVTVNEGHFVQKGHACEINFYATGTFAANSTVTLGRITGMSAPISNIRCAGGCGVSGSTANASCYLVLDPGGNLSAYPSVACNAIVINIPYIA